MTFEIAGWFIVLASLFIMAAPIRWHAAYGTWWGKRMTSPMIRILSPIPAIFGTGLIYAAILAEGDIPRRAAPLNYGCIGLTPRRVEAERYFQHSSPRFRVNKTTLSE